jgi:hypothetical protein
MKLTTVSKFGTLCKGKLRLHFLQGVHDNGQCLILELRTQRREKAPAGPRKRPLELHAGHIRKNLLEAPQGDVDESGARDGETQRDAEQLAHEHEGDGIRHVRWVENALDDGIARLEIRTDAEAE